MATLNVPKTLADVAKWEVNPAYTRETVTIASGAGSLTVGAVLGKVTATGKYVLSDPAAVDGSETAAAVLLADTDASAADATALVLLRGPAIVSKGDLVFHANVDTQPEKDAKYAELAALGILVRETA